jgi:hypothetical protein
LAGEFQNLGVSLKTVYPGGGRMPRKKKVTAPMSVFHKQQSAREQMRSLENYEPPDNAEDLDNREMAAARRKKRASRPT